MVHHSYLPTTPTIAWPHKSHTPTPIAIPSQVATHPWHISKLEKLLQSHGSKVSPVKGDNILCAAARFGNVKGVEMILNHGYDVNEKTEILTEGMKSKLTTDAHSHVVEDANRQVRSTLQASLHWRLLRYGDNLNV